MVDQEHFHDAFTRLFNHRGVRLDNHAIAAGHCTGGYRLWGAAFNFDKAHAAICRDRELVVIAKTWDFGADLFGRLKDAGSGRNFDFCAVNGNFWHGLAYFR